MEINQESLIYMESDEIHLSRLHHEIYSINDHKEVEHSSDDMPILALLGSQLVTPSRLLRVFHDLPFHYLQLADRINKTKALWVLTCPLTFS